jgi:hypothetical protein
LEDKEQVFVWLNRAATNAFEGVPMLRFDPLWDKVTADPRYAALLKNSGLNL